MHPHGPEQPQKHTPEFNLQKIASDFVASGNKKLLKMTWL